MTTKSDFTEEEWTRIRRAPLVAGMAISLADPGGPIEMGKETVATLKASTNPPSREQLLTEVALDLQAMTQRKENPLSGFTVSKDGPPPGQQILDELRAVRQVVAAKANPEESAAFVAWLLAAAKAAAEAAKEGGFMGFGATLVSEGEQKMLEQLGAALA